MSGVEPKRPRAGQRAAAAAGEAGPSGEPAEDAEMSDAHAVSSDDASGEGECTTTVQPLCMMIFASGRTSARSPDVRF